MPKIRVDKVSLTLDGTGKLAWDAWAVDDEDVVIPGRHMTILTDAGETLDALNDASPLLALEALLRANVPIGWTDKALSERIAANLNSATVTGLLNEFVQGISGYPISFDA